MFEDWKIIKTNLWISKPTPWMFLFIYVKFERRWTKLFLLKSFLIIISFLFCIPAILIFFSSVFFTLWQVATSIRIGIPKSINMVAVENSKHSKASVTRGTRSAVPLQVICKKIILSFLLFIISFFILKKKKKKCSIWFFNPSETFPVFHFFLFHYSQLTHQLHFFYMWFFMKITHFFF